MGFDVISVKDVRDVSVRDLYPDDLQSRSGLSRLVDLATLQPALEIIEAHESPRLVRQFVTSKLKASYFSVAEIDEWGKEHGYDFLRLEEIHPLYIAYVRLYERLERDIEKFRELEDELGYAGEDSSYAAFREQVCKTPRPMPEVTPAPCTERIPLDITAYELQLAQLRVFTARQKKELDTATAHNKTLRKQANDDHRIIEKLERQLQLATENRPDLSCKKIKRTGIPFTPADLPDVGKLEKTTIEAFDSILPKESLLPLLRPTSLKAIAGVYFLMNDDDEIVYIGQSVNVAARIGQHCIDKRKHPHFTKVAAVSVPASRLLEIEAKYIAAYSPILNGTTEEKINDRVLARLKLKKSRRWKKTATTGQKQSNSHKQQSGASA